MFRLFSPLIACLIFPLAYSLVDFTLSCQRGYKVSAIHRSNSIHQNGRAGSLGIECQSIVDTDLDSIVCQTLTSTPQCNGQIEGCSGNQWLAGFHAYGIENKTNVVLLDPVCCSSPKIKLDSTTCATERINEAVKPFQHEIFGGLVYRGIQCWHQFDTNNTLVDLVWKTEICQLLSSHGTGAHDFAAAASSNCPVCNCHCGIETCTNGHEPIRVIHKHLDQQCSCDCLCRYECI